MEFEIEANTGNGKCKYFCVQIRFWTKLQIDQVKIWFQSRKQLIKSKRHHLGMLALKLLGQPLIFLFQPLCQCYFLLRQNSGWERILESNSWSKIRFTETCVSICPRSFWHCSRSVSTSPERSWLWWSVTGSVVQMGGGGALWGPLGAPIRGFHHFFGNSLGPPRVNGTPSEPLDGIWEISILWKLLLEILTDEMSMTKSDALSSYQSYSNRSLTDVFVPASFSICWPFVRSLLSSTYSWFSDRASLINLLFVNFLDVIYCRFYVDTNISAKSKPITGISTVVFRSLCILVFAE